MVNKIGRVCINATSRSSAYSGYTESMRQSFQTSNDDSVIAVKKDQKLLLDIEPEQ
jgi:hypothetical protein